jgi:2-iminoacetate synthase
MDAVSMDLKSWADSRVHAAEVDRYLEASGQDFVDDGAIAHALAQAKAPDDARLQALLDKSLAIQDLSLAEAAELMAVRSPQQRKRMADAALAVKEKVYGKCIAAFAPLYLGNACVNACSYCGFLTNRTDETRRVLSEAEISAEVEVLAGQVGHRLLLAVVGEHPSSDAKYMADSLAAIHAVQAPQGTRYSQVRCVGLNAPPMCIADLQAIQAAGLASYHVHQATYDRAAYQAAHRDGPKADYRWRLYAMHRAMEAGIPNVGLGILAGLADWRFELLALLQHAQALEGRFGRGPASINLQRLDPRNPAADPTYAVTEDEFLRLLTVLRLALPYVGLIVTAAEGHSLRQKALRLGATQTDAAPAVGVGAYHQGGVIPSMSCRQFALGDAEPLQDLVSELCEAGSLASFCPPCSLGLRPAKEAMAALRSGATAKACQLNAILTFKEWVEDFADPEAAALGEALLQSEIADVSQRQPESYAQLMDYFKRTSDGERGLAF